MPKVFLPTIKNNFYVSGQDSDLEENEDILFILLENSEHQERENFKRHPLLDQAARNKAVDMAEKNYFSHTSPEGITPNEIARSTGYRLPRHYPMKGNNIESINIGSGIPERTMKSWLDSPKHREHVFGESFFYKGQECIGIGTAVNQEGRVISVFLSAPCGDN